MFRVDLKAMLQLSKSTEGTLRMHSRIRGKGKVSYYVCYELHNDLLTIQRVRRIRIARSKRLKRQRTPSRRPRQVSVMCQTSILERNVPTAVFVDVASETLSLERSNIGVDTLDLSLKICRLQQTFKISKITASSQTKQSKLEEHSTQMELNVKTRWTQTNLEMYRTSVAGTQTAETVQFRRSSTQTTMAEDEEMLLSPHLELLHLLLRSSCSQGQLLFRGVESINQLVEFKQLELQKQRIAAIAAAEAEAVAQKEKEREEEEEAKIVAQTKAKLEAAMKAKKLSEVKQLYSKRARLRCKHRCCLHMQRNKTRFAPTKLNRETQTQSQLTPTDCKWTQTKVATNFVAATQTDGDRDRDRDKERERDKEKGFLWLRRSS